MKRWMIPVAILALATPALAQDSFDLPFPMQSLADDIAAGNREEAIRRIDMVDTISMGPPLVSSSRDFVDRLLGCSIAESSEQYRSTDMSLIETKWSCDAGTYHVLLSNSAGSPYVTVADFQTEESLQTRRVQPPPIAVRPAPPVLTAEQRERIRRVETAQRLTICNALGQALIDGDASGLQEVSNERTRYMFGFHDPFTSTMVVEEDGTSEAAAQVMIDAALAAVGMPDGYECDENNTMGIVRWNFSSADRSLFAFPREYNGELTLVSLRFANRERLLEAQAMNAEMQEAQ